MATAPIRHEHPATPPHTGNGRLVAKLLLAVAASFAFGFALVPLYDVLCAVTGLNGKTSGGFGIGGLGRDTPPPEAIDRSRLVNVEFTGTVMPGLPWEMRALTFSIDLHPGEMRQVTYLVHNRSDRPITGQAVPSVSPGQAARHFDKIECFCFTQQTLAPGETREMPLTFIIKPEIDPEVRTVSISYAFFNTADTPSAANREQP